MVADSEIHDHQARFRIVDAGFAVGAELTPTQKVRRHYVAGKYAADIEALYA
jgi:long-chain acyl-CoA synthetase